MKRSAYLKIAAVAVLIVMAVTCLCGCGDDAGTPAEKTPAEKYSDAQFLLANGEYEKAADAFNALGDYEESARLTAYCRAAAAGESGDYEACMTAFEMLEDYKESKLMICYYQARELQTEGGKTMEKAREAKNAEARELQEKGLETLAQAADAYRKVSTFKDSAERMEACGEIVYDAAKVCGNGGDYEKAALYYELLGKYRDAAEQVKEMKYQWAGALTKAGKTEEAFAVYEQIAGYRDVNRILAGAGNDGAETEAPEILWQKGDIVTFGEYYIVSETKKDPIEWLVLDYSEKDNRALVISRYGLETAAYHDSDETVTWENSSIRAWLNGEFMDEAFSDGEKAAVPAVTVDNGAAQNYSGVQRSGGKNTEDKVFLLSYAETEKYFADDRSRICEPSVNSVNQGCTVGVNSFTDGKKACFWWLRSPANEENEEFHVNTDGSRGHYFAVNKFRVVRPAMWINVGAEQVRYEDAERLQREKKYAEAIASYRVLGAYSDADYKARECQELAYEAAVKLMNDGRYEEAVIAFRVPGSYSDSAAKISECEDKIRERDHAAAMKLKESGKYEEAVAAFEALGDYSDSAAQAEECRQMILQEQYDAAMKLKNEKKYEEAIAAFEALDGFGDSAAQAEECRQLILQEQYDAASSLKDAEKYEEAIPAFEALGDFSDSAAQAEECRALIPQREYNAAMKLKNEGRFEEAAAAFEALDGFSDSATQVTDTRYEKANALNRDGKYEEAYLLYVSLGDYRDCGSIIANDANIAAVAAARAAYLDSFRTAGGIAVYGRYEQDGSDEDGTEPVEWLVLTYDAEADRALLLSRCALDCLPVDGADPFTWEESSVRGWLNGIFVSAAFTPEEQAAVPAVTVSADPNPARNTAAGNDTQDQVFLLSVAEVETFFADAAARRCAPTDYAVKKGAWASDEYDLDGKGTCFWWLRTPGLNGNCAADVSSSGDLRQDGDHVDTPYPAVRPALWVSVSELPWAL